MATEKREFKAEIAEMLDLVVNSLYSKKEIFLRELVSNASDAIDRAKYLALTDKTIAPENPEWKIEIVSDREAKTLTVSDNGIGMDAADLENDYVIGSTFQKANGHNDFDSAYPFGAIRLCAVITLPPVTKYIPSTTMKMYAKSSATPPGGALRASGETSDAPKSNRSKNSNQSTGKRRSFNYGRQT